MKSLVGLAGGGLVALAFAALAACNPYLYAESPAPPGRTARLDRVDGFWALKYYRMELSSGVAVALTCYHAGPCEHVRVTTDDPNVAEVRTASLGVLDKSYFTGDAKQAAAFVVVGKTAGKTTVHLVAEEGHRDVVVTVIPPPGAPGAPNVKATAAR